MKRAPLVRLYDDEVCLDGFAGGGGTSTGIEMVLGRPPHFAINRKRDFFFHMLKSIRVYALCQVSPPTVNGSASIRY